MQISFRCQLPRFTRVFALLGLLSANPLHSAEPPPIHPGTARAGDPRPEHFPHRIWAACDFEGHSPDYGWFGRIETNQVPPYPGNFTALSAAPGPYQSQSALMTGINPVP